jgi:ABC-type phosphate/phosphonate transport system substrate-binding protein
MENIYEILKKYNAVKDKKELLELYWLRQIKVNDRMLTELNEIDNIETIQIGQRVIFV